MARDQIDAARMSLAAGFGFQAVSTSYYAMLYAARAALSEEDLYAKTHGGTWNLFGQTFVDSGRFDLVLLADARGTQEDRTGTDYEAARPSDERANEIVALAERFVDAVAELVGG